MAQTKAQKAPPQLSVRFDDREMLEAAAYKWGLRENLIESTTDSNLSVFLRKIIQDYITGFCEMYGGPDAVRAEFRRARRAETEALLQQMAALDD